MVFIFTPFNYFIAMNALRHGKMHLNFVEKTQFLVLLMKMKFPIIFGTIFRAIKHGKKRNSGEKLA